MYLLFDIGGTKMRLTTSQDGVNLNEIKSYDTPNRFEDVFNLLSEYKGGSYEAVAGGLPGVFDNEKTLLLRAPNLPEWIGKPIKKKLQDYFGAQVYLENDANLAGLGEAGIGAGRDFKIVAYVTVSTGIGGARIVDKKIDASTWGFEPGHQIIDADVTIWPEGKDFGHESLTSGSISSYISGTALAVRYGKHAFEIEDPQVWNDVEKLLAVGLYNTIVHWSPGVVVLGGGMILNGAISINKTGDHLKKLMKIFPEIPELRKAELGDSSALHGALFLVKSG